MIDTSPKSTTYELGWHDDIDYAYAADRGLDKQHIRDLSGDRTLIKFGTGDEVTVQAAEHGIRFLLISGAPIDEPVAWHGPIVMNTQAELKTAIAELNNGTFIKPAH